uniref:Uncharacterized protein n=1 Tax=viral metagenome TaxID=1070528 RepID=A0A6M3LA58_9ZZZZ
MYDKWNSRWKRHPKSGYRMLDYRYEDHHQRFVRRVQDSPLVCQDCGGRGEHFEDYVAGHALYSPCGWCEGTGHMLPWQRGLWLRMKKEEKREKVLFFQRSHLGGSSLGDV